MTLRSSEIRNFLSWRVSTILKSFFLASASCHLALPHIIRPMLRVSNLLRRSSFSLQNSIAPSSSRGKRPWRRRVVSRFDTGYAWSDWAPGSLSIHILSRIRKVLLDEQEEVGLLGFALAFDRLAKANTSVFNANTSVFVSEVSCSLSSYSLSIKSVTNLFNPWEILTTSESCLCLKIQV